MGRAILLYDDDCGFCRWTADRILRRDRRHVLRAVPIQSAEGDSLLGDMPSEEKVASWHLVDEDGVVRSAGAATGPLLRRLPGGKPVAIAADRFPRATNLLYRLIARNRDTFGRILGQTACSVDPSARSRR